MHRTLVAQMMGGMMGGGGGMGGMGGMDEKAMAKMLEVRHREPVV